MLEMYHLIIFSVFLSGRNEASAGNRMGKCSIGQQLGAKRLRGRLLLLPTGTDGFGAVLQQCQPPFVPGCYGLAAAGNKSSTQLPLPPPGCGGEWKETGRNWWVGIRAV